MTTAEPTYRARPEAVTWRTVPDGAVLLDLSTSTYQSLNRTGALLWERLADGATRTQLVDTLASAFPVERDAVAGDVDRFLDGCQAKGYLAVDA